jgi:hypothetical protein
MDNCGCCHGGGGESENNKKKHDAEVMNTFYPT